MLILVPSFQQTQNICVTCLQCWPNDLDVGPILYTCYKNVLLLLGCGLIKTIRKAFYFTHLVAVQWQICVYFTLHSYWKFTKSSPIVLRKECIFSKIGQYCVISLVLQSDGWLLTAGSLLLMRCPARPSSSAARRRRRTSAVDMPATV